MSKLPCFELQMNPLTSPNVGDEQEKHGVVSNVLDTLLAAVLLEQDPISSVTRSVSWNGVFEVYL